MPLYETKCNPTDVLVFKIFGEKKERADNISMSHKINKFHVHMGEDVERCTIRSKNDKITNFRFAKEDTF